MPSAPCIERPGFTVKQLIELVTLWCFFQKFWQRETHSYVASSRKRLLHSLNIGGVSVAHWEMNVCVCKWKIHAPARWVLMSSTCKQLSKIELCASLWEKDLRMVPTEKCFRRGEVKLWRYYNKWSSHKLLLVEDLEKIAFGLRGRWGNVQCAAWRPPVQQVKLFPEITLCWLKYLCSLLEVTLPEPELP